MQRKRGSAARHFKELRPTTEPDFYIPRTSVTAGGDRSRWWSNSRMTYGLYGTRRSAQHLSLSETT